MTRDKLINLLKEIRTQTEDGKIRWFETSSEDAFRLRVGDNLIRVTAYSYREGNVFAILQGNAKMLYTVSLVDKFGRVLDELSSEETGNQWVKDLFISARFSALNVDNVIDQMFQDLASGNIGRPEDTNKEEDEGRTE